MSKLTRFIADAPVSRLTRACATAAIVSALAAGCADSPVTPKTVATADAAHSTAPAALTHVRGLMRSSPLTGPVVVTKTLSIAGGVIDVPGADFQLIVPPNAFGGPPIKFTITAYAGKVIAYDFQPHGMKFIRPLKAVQGLNNTLWQTLDLSLATTTWSGAYFANASQIDETTGDASVNEFMPCVIDLVTGTMIFNIPHFSGYMISTGRSDGGAM